MTTKNLHNHLESDYPASQASNVDSLTFECGLSQEIIKNISKIKKEPGWLLDWRLNSYNLWKNMEAPLWGNLNYKPIDFQKISYFSSPKKIPNLKSLDEADKELLETFNKLGIPLEEQKRLAGVAMDVVFDSVSVATTFHESLEKLGIIFCSFSEGVQKHPELVREYLGSVVPAEDNFFAALNSAVFTDGSFCYIPKGAKCPMELSTYFRINAANTGQFERTLIIADEDSYVSYLEGCTAPMRSENQLHAAIVEIYAKKNAEVRYSTVQNWYPGDKNGVGGIYNFVTKRGLCAGKKSKIYWTQVETGSAITWKYPSCILLGDESIGEFNSVAITKGKQQADTGTKMIHIGKNTSSRIVAKGISAQNGKNSYRGQVKITKNAENSINFSQCDSLLIGNNCSAHTFPYIDSYKNSKSKVMHEATTSKIDEEKLFYCMQRGLSSEEAVGLIVGGFCKEVLNKLPMEFAVEARKLLEITLEGSVG